MVCARVCEKKKCEAPFLRVCQIERLQGLAFGGEGAAKMSATDKQKVKP